MAETAPKKIAIIVSSTRAIRAGPNVVDFVHKVLLAAPATPKPTLSILDIASFNLPVFNERAMPAMVPAKASFEYEHSKAWSAAMASFDGYIFVSPEYNYGMPGGVKNAIDYLYNEWIGRPVLIVTYGIKGGEISSASLKQTLEGMKLRVMETRPMLVYADMGEVFMAAGGGVVGPKTMESWEETGKEPLLKGFEELVVALHTPHPVVEEVKV